MTSPRRLNFYGHFSRGPLMRARKAKRIFDLELPKCLALDGQDRVDALVALNERCSKIARDRKSPSPPLATPASRESGPA